MLCLMIRVRWSEGERLNISQNVSTHQPFHDVSHTHLKYFISLAFGHLIYITGKYG